MKKVLATLLSAVCMLSLSACTGATESPEAAGYFIDNCGKTFHLDKAPERVVLQSASPVPAMSALGVLDKVVARAGFFPKEYFSDEVNQKLAEIPSLSDRLDASGHVQISKEAVMSTQPDAVIGMTDSVNPQSVTEIPVFMEPVFCGAVKDASWKTVNEEVDLFAKIFDVADRADAVKKDVADKVAALDKEAGKGKTVAVVYPGMPGSTFYAYGRDSMSNPVVESVGLTNVFAEESQRVFEISAEQLVAKNPDVILILHSNEPDLEDTVRNLPGAETITAVKENAMFAMPLLFAEPATPLAVVGAQKLEAFLKSNG